MARPVGTKYIETPEKLWDLFTQYKNEVKKNPRKKMVFGGKDFSSDFELLERPLTLEGFENHCADLDIIQDLGHYFANTDNRYADYCTICSRIRKTIRQDQIEGGMVGQYNSSITQRLNGLVDKSQVDVKTEQPLFPEK
jgi:hypothetical protein